MNADLSRMIAQSDRNKRALLATAVQAELERVGRNYIALAARQERIVKALIAAGLAHLPDSDEALTLEGIAEAQDEAAHLTGGKK